MEKFQPLKRTSLRKAFPGSHAETRHLTPLVFYEPPLSFNVEKVLLVGNRVKVRGPTNTFLYHDFYKF